MKSLKEIVVVAALGVALMAQVMHGYADPVAGVVKGKVTAVSANTVTIEGRTVRIKPGSAAAAALQSIPVGQEVQVVVDGTGTVASVATVSEM